MARLFSDYFPELKGNNPVRFDIPIDLGEILDSNGNEILEFDAVDSAVNHVQIANAATGNGPAIVAAGADTNIDVSLDGKGTGVVNVAMAAGSGGLRSKRSVLASSGNTTLTTDMSGSVMLLDTAAVDYTLPAISADDVGMYFDFVSTIIATDQTITAQAADLLTGAVTITHTAAAGTDTFAPDVTDDLIITLNGTTTGGATVGSWCRLTAISATRWFVEGIFTGSGTLATPFS